MGPRRPHGIRLLRNGHETRTRLVRQTVSIHAVGAAAPSLRLAAADVAAAWGSRAGKGQVAVCAPDEDVLTLSWLAVVRALANAGRSPGEVDGLWWGTTRPPLAEGPSLAMLGAALRLRNDVGGALMSGSAHAGMEALTGAWHAVAAGTHRSRRCRRRRCVGSGAGHSVGVAGWSGRGRVRADRRSRPGHPGVDDPAEPAGTRSLPRRWRGLDTRCVRLAPVPRGRVSTAAHRRCERNRRRGCCGRCPIRTAGSAPSWLVGSASTPHRPPRPTPSWAMPARRRRYWACAPPWVVAGRAAVVGYGGGRATGHSRRRQRNRRRLVRRARSRPGRQLPRSATCPRSARRLG